MPGSPWMFYIIANRGRTYAGVSPNPVRRLRQHNGEISGGAKYTTGVGSGWEHVCIVDGFRTNIEALQFEWAVKHEKPRGQGGMRMRLKKLHQVLGKERWTSRAPPASEVPLHLRWLVDPVYTADVPSYISVEFVLLGSDGGGVGQVEPGDSGRGVHEGAGVGQEGLGGVVHGEVSP